MCDWLAVVAQPLDADGVRWVCFDVLCFSCGHSVWTLFPDPLLKSD